MRGRDFLELAKELLPGTLPRHRRGVVIHAYYALLLECRDAMERWGLPALPRQQVHAGIRLRLVYATDPALEQLGQSKDRLVQDRNRASYNLRPLSDFASGQRAVKVVTEAAAQIALLDAIDSDPVRRAAALASITP